VHCACIPCLFLENRASCQVRLDEDAVLVSTGLSLVQVKD
jgi:hypothetical protein